MSIRIQLKPHVWVEFELIGPGGEELGVARFRCRAMRREAFESETKQGANEFVATIVEDWEGFEEKFSPKALLELMSVVPSAGVQIVREYTKALFATARKN
jgi:hypothetical protein